MAVGLYDQVKWVFYSFVITLFIFIHKHRLLVLNGAVLMYTHVPPVGRHQGNVTRLANCGFWRHISYKIGNQFKVPRLLFILMH